MKDPNTRNSFLYLIGIMALIGLMFFVVIQLSEGEIGLIENPAEKTYKQAPEKVIEDGVDYQALIKTNQGDITIDLLENNAPNTVNNFVFLAEDGFYDKVQFHRVVQDFVIQSGSRLTLDDNPNNDGVGGPGYKFNDEINWNSLNLDSDTQDDLREAGYSPDNNVRSVPLAKYTVAMANAGANTNGSQFFIVTGEKSDDSIEALNGKHTVFAKVIDGMSVVDKINDVELTDINTPSPRPRSAVIIESVQIIKK
jgi:cyclophilin family peptidyl-prolyl cis-trans isomerase